MQTCEAPGVMGSKGLRVGVVLWGQADGIAPLISGTLEDLGCQVTNFLFDARLPDELDVVFVHGPSDSLVPLASQLLDCPPAKRPLLVFWMLEPLPNPDLPEWIRYTVGAMRSAAERLAFCRQSQGGWQLNPLLRWTTTRAYRFRYYGDLHWLRRHGILSVLAMTSRWNAGFLRARGFDPIVAYVGSHPDWGADLELERDVPVLWLGKIATSRRRRLLKRIRAELRQRGVEILMIDGIENPYVFGHERTIMLNCTKIVLNIGRKKWDKNSVRYFLAAPNRALIVTEPTLPHLPFVHGVHLIEAPIDRIADAICHYLSHEEERQRIVDQAYQLVTTDLTMRKGIEQILEQVVIVRQKGQKQTRQRCREDTQ